MEIQQGSRDAWLEGVQIFLDIDIVRLYSMHSTVPAKHGKQYHKPDGQLQEAGDQCEFINEQSSASAIQQSISKYRYKREADKA